MPGRNLRSTRKGKDAHKDWSKLNEGSPLSDPEPEEFIPAAASKTNKKKKKKAAKKQKNSTTTELQAALAVTNVDDENSVNADTSEGESRSYQQSINIDGDISSPSSEFEEDDALVKAKQKLKKLKSDERKIRREEKLRKIEEETKRLQKSLKQKKRSRKVTTSDLRSMENVRYDVDKFMDNKKLNFKNQSDTDSEGVTSAGTSDESSETDSDKDVKKKKETSSEKKKKSGKESKLTSYVKFPQKWPHSHLKHHFVAKNKKYDDLSLAEFCAGYLSILRKCKSSKMARIEHLEDLMYHATTKPWRNVLNYHAACLLEIERGNLKWGDNFQIHGVGSMTLFGAGAHGSNSRGSTQYSEGNGRQQNSGNDERVWFCKNFQRGTCTFTRDHYGQALGHNHLLKHICAKCWLTVKKQSPHSEESESCPLFKVEF